MTARRVTDEDVSRTRRPAATTPESRENQLIAAAVDLAEKQIIEGTASAQVITHYLKLGSTREKLEQERLKHENLLTQAKIEGMASAARIEEKYDAALVAMRRYSGQEPLPTAGDFADEDIR